MKQGLWSLKWDKDHLILLDQTKLPDEIVYIDCYSYKDVVSAIKTLAVRGAPAIGVAAGYASVLAFRECRAYSDTGLTERFYAALDELEASRPTAVNLSWAISEMKEVYSHSESLETAGAELLNKAKDIEYSDRDMCRRIGSHGADLFKGKTALNILTHCNTGALATAGDGTAFSVIKELNERGQISCVYADETRPLLQGSRLTATELMANEIPCCLITDNMAAMLMNTRHIDAIIVGADRIALNGDGANKIGTYGLAVLASYHHIPFYLAAPFSTFDTSIKSGGEIVIEERNPDEVRTYKGIQLAPKDVPVFNPAFDVTPNHLITGIITEKGVIVPPYTDNIKRFYKEEG